MDKKRYANKHLFAVDFRANTLSLILFTLVIGALMFLVLALFPSMTAMLAKMPDELKQYVAMDNISTYFSTEALSIWIMIGGFYAVWLGAKLTSGDFKNNTYETLYTLNLSRCEILRTKALVLISLMAIFNVGVGVFGLAGLLIFGEKVMVTNLLVYVLVAFVLSLLIGFLSFGWGLAGKRKYNVIIGWILVVVFYIIATLSSAVDWLGYFSPFSAIKGDIISLGFGGIANYGLSLVVWGAFAIGNLIITVTQFKSADLD